MKKVHEKLHELIPAKASAEEKGIIITRSRTLVGSSESCELVITSPSVSPIHAIIEFTDEHAGKIYDMNSTHGTYVNDVKMLHGAFSLGDRLKFGEVEYFFRAYVQEEVLPPVLEMLHPDSGPEAATPPVALPVMAVGKRSLPSSAFEPRPSFEMAAATSAAVNSIYPLAWDPKADSCEYIFEDVDSLYPIFSYDLEGSSIEVIILHKEKVFDIHYLWMIDGTVYLSGDAVSGPKVVKAGKQREVLVEFPGLGRGERVDFLRIQGGQVQLRRLDGYLVANLAELGKDGGLGTSARKGDFAPLGKDDVCTLRKDDLQILVRKAESPPKVKHSSSWKRDKALIKFVGGALLAATVFNLVFFNLKVRPRDPLTARPERIPSFLIKAVEEAEGPTTKKIQQAYAYDASSALAKDKAARPASISREHWIKGPLRTEELKKTMGEHLKELQSCRQRALANEKGKSSMLHLTIGASGHVSHASFEELHGAPFSATLQSCLYEVLKGLKFDLTSSPEDVKGRVEVDWPVNLLSHNK